jgi:beta-lactam-binding protein with PASTA domain
MPNVIGEMMAQAERSLQKIGVRAVIVLKPAGRHVPAGTVWRQYPPAGSTVARGLAVTLYVQPAA